MSFNLIIMRNRTLLPFLLSLFLFSQNFSFGQDEDYFSGLSTDEINRYYSEINTNGLITEIEDVPNEKVSSNKNVSDPHNLLADFAEQKIQVITDRLKNEKDYEIMVVCLNSIGSSEPHAWGTDLFNLWQIGDKDTENGLLILVVNDAHVVTFITGRGMETVFTDAETNGIQQSYMVPFFKINDYNTGVIRGVQAVENHLNGKAMLYDSDPNDTSSDYLYENEIPATPFYKNEFFIGYSIFCGALIVLYFIFLLIAFNTKDLHKRYRTVKLWSLLIFAILAPIPFIFLVILARKMSHKWRNMERIGYQTGELLHKLNEEEEDKYLSQGQITEEVVKSIDYDVWINVAGTEIVVLPYINWFTKYDKCEKCKFKTYYKVYDRTVVSATYSNTGVGEKKHKCENCGHEKIIKYTIPRKQKSSSRGFYSGGGSFGGGGRSFGGGGGSFGGGGGSFGGGSSRGGGSSSSW